jgi:Ca2+-binding RTX toxin-like protein
MSLRRITSLGVIMTLVLIGLSAVSAVAASNTVPASNLDDDSFGITANDLKPSECAGINLTNVVVVSGIGAGTSGNDLILGSTGGDWMFGRGGDDCIIAGGGDDRIFGNNGTDVCNGGAGSDNAFQCETELNIP